jgi:hypothetical protein
MSIAEFKPVRKELAALRAFVSEIWKGAEKSSHDHIYARCGDVLEHIGDLTTSLRLLEVAIDPASAKVSEKPTPETPEE